MVSETGSPLSRSPPVDEQTSVLSRETDEALQPQPVSLVYTADRFLPIKMHQFLDFAAPRLRERLAT